MRNAVWLLMTVLFLSCSSYRGIPSHGGGKRFSEEQRVVTGAIRQAVARMDLRELQGERVQIVVTGIPSSGGASINWGGLQSINFNGSLNDSARQFAQSFVLDAVRPGMPVDSRVEESNSNENFGVNASYRRHTLFNPQGHGTGGDLEYLRSSLLMKALHDGVDVLSGNPTFQLHVLVDALGTNRSRDTKVIYREDELVGSCDLSYFAVDLRSKGLAFMARRSTADGTYLERHFDFLPVKAMVETELAATDRPELPVTEMGAKIEEEWEPVGTIQMGKGSPETFYVHREGTKIAVGNGDQKRIVISEWVTWTGQPKEGWALNSGDSFQVADLDGDGTDEILVGSSDRSWLGVIECQDGSLRMGSLVHDWVNHAHTEGKSGWDLWEGDSFSVVDSVSSGPSEIVVVNAQRSWLGFLRYESGRLITDRIQRLSL